MATWVFVLPVALSAQDAGDAGRTRTEIALGIFRLVQQESKPATVAAELKAGIRSYRMRCNRVSDYQIFARSDGRIDLKVKCAGVPLYGMTVGSNGFLNVFGGNGMVSPFDRQDAMIYGFNPDGSLITRSAQLIEPDGSSSDIILNTSEGWVTLLLMVSLIGVGVFGVSALTIFMRKHKESGSVGDVFSNLTSELKDKMWQDASEISQYVRRHPSGIFIAVGPKGKRRLFSRKFGAKSYAAKGYKFFEVFRVDLDHESLH